ncbi:AsmA family protein [Granulosicoccaceae sp. 1_MG-2023]|nr:AsmA family protein [Granulosicoccaceae sp. 1_MG-2023]
MKILKRLIIGLVAVVVLVFVVLAIVISTLDLNQYKEQIQKIVMDQTGRELDIRGELDASFFPWLGFSIGEVGLANAEGFGDEPFAEISRADVRVEVLPLLRKQVNVDNVTLNGLVLNLERNAQGVTNWDDLMQASATTSTTTDNNETTEVEVEGGAPAIAALAVGGVSISNANVSWNDKQAGTDAQLSNFNLKTGAVTLAKPFKLQTGFEVVSNSMALQASLEAAGDVTLDLEQQRYLLTDLTLEATADGAVVPVDNAALNLAADIIADLGSQTVDVSDLVLQAMGITLQGSLDVTGLDSNPVVTGQLATAKPFNLRDVLAKLGLDAPETADADVLKQVGLELALSASAEKAELSELILRLDQSTFTGNLAVPDLAGDLPPLRFDFNVDDIDLDRYLPAATEAAAAQGSDEAVAAADDVPIELPLELIRKLDVAGTFSVGKFKIRNLITSDIRIPLEAKGGQVSLNGIAANLYRGTVSSDLSLNAKSDTPSYGARVDLAGVLVDPLLADLLQDNAPLSGRGDFSLDITTAGNSVNALKSGLNGDYSLNFSDGAINGINIGYQLRRARATIRGEELSDADKLKKTDFSALTMSGTFTDGVLASDDLDMRAPALRLGGDGTVDLNKSYVDYTLKTKVTETSKGQGGKDADELSGVSLNVPVRGTFDELSADFTKVIINAMTEDLKNKFKDAQDKAKAQAEAALKEKEAEVKARLKEEEAKAKAKLQTELNEKQDAAKAELEEKKQEELDKLKKQAEEKLKGLFN